MLVNKTRNIRKRASKPRTESLSSFKPFSYFFPDVSIRPGRYKILKRNDILQILDPSVVSAGV